MDRPKDGQEILPSEFRLVKYKILSFCVGAEALVCPARAEGSKTGIRYSVCSQSTRRSSRTLEVRAHSETSVAVETRPERSECRSGRVLC
jgi:hypothetical protein